MEQYEPRGRLRSEPSSPTIDISADEWGTSEEIDLGGLEEHDLFLQQDYVQPKNRDVLPFRAHSPASHSNGNYGKLPRERSQNNATGSDEGSDPSQGIQLSKIDSFDSGYSRADSPSSSVIYQMPNYQQFAGKLAPSSPTSVVISFIIIIVILFVTILPIILPQTTTSQNDADFNDYVIESDSSSSQKQEEHADARCKCICPPPALKNEKSDTNPTQRRLYVGNTYPNQCNCNNIVQPHLGDIKMLIKDFCVRCECRYQSRNTSTIRRNVVFFLAVLTGLCLYMLFQYLLKYLRLTRRNLPRQLRWLSYQLTES